jgi:transcriptional regulator with XRE-family HTH domain
MDTLTGYDSQNLVHLLIEERKRQRVSQNQLADRMQMKQPYLHLVEKGTYKSQISTLERYAASLGKRIVYRLVDA